MPFPNKSLPHKKSHSDLSFTNNFLSDTLEINSIKAELGSNTFPFFLPRNKPTPKGSTSILFLSSTNPLSAK